MEIIKNICKLFHMKIWIISYRLTFKKIPINMIKIDPALINVIRSFRKKTPIKIEKIIPDSLNAPTNGIGALVKHQTTIP